MLKDNKIIKVGFDLDGVILYNPARLIRPIMSFVKGKKLVKRKELQFYHPKTKLSKWMWRMFHKSSLFVSPGFNELRDLVKKNKIEAYLITGRFNYLKKDLDKWLKRIKSDRIFKEVFWNKKNQHPHLFKEKMIKQLNLDIFVEDNWDIVHYLSNVFSKKIKRKKNCNSSKPRVYWVYNFIDRKIEYPHKVNGLKTAIQNIKKVIKEIST